MRVRAAVAHQAGARLTVETIDLEGRIVGVLCAFPLVKAIGSHLTLMRWLVIAVIIYAAISMLQSARRSRAVIEATI